MADPRFVVQHHLATADHYDVRLEIDGVLVSWAVPKGPSLDPAQHRLAIRVDDHALSHETFEGMTGGRGRGVVQVWDRGAYRNLSHRGSTPVDAKEGLAQGRLTFHLDGTKLHGAFSLVRTRRRQGGRESWLLIKKSDDEARPHNQPVTAQDRSVLSGRTVDEIEADG